MEKSELKEKARSLPYSPGVYLMLDKTGEVIYVGKAKQLKNRVSQYFQDSAGHSPKTRRMVSLIHDFDVIIAGTEYDALLLECSLIKRHMPKYNILLKDDKGFPYIRLDEKKEYPRFSIVAKPADDGARYFGPYSGRVVIRRSLTSIQKALKLPTCTRVFPRDVGKARPCLNYHLGNCAGYCRSDADHGRYMQDIGRAALMLEGKTEAVSEGMKADMEQAAEELRFEHAASLRNQLRAIEAMSKQQHMVSGAMADTDVVGYYQGENKSCFTVLHYIGGRLLDKDFEIMETPLEAEAADMVSSLVKQYYVKRGMAPKTILLPCEMDDSELFEQMIQNEMGVKASIVNPKRGYKKELIEIAASNAMEEAKRATTKEERISKTMELLRGALGLENRPSRIEAYDISNTAGSDVVGGMTVFVDGKPLKRDYKRFKIKLIEGQDDYGSMREVLRRRFARYADQPDGNSGFSARPDLILIDGGQAHASAAETVLSEHGLDIPIFGMVKDDRHRTRALITASGWEIGISATPVVFALIGTIQEETHRFAIEYHRNLRSKRVKGSELDNINGVGDARRTALIKHFRTIENIKRAELDELAGVVPKNTAKAVYDYFHGNAGEGAKEQ